jgi:hypothetical protein
MEVRGFEVIIVKRKEFADILLCRFIVHFMVMGVVLTLFEHDLVGMGGKVDVDCKVVTSRNRRESNLYLELPI